MLKCSCPRLAAAVVVAGVTCALASAGAQTVEQKKDGKFVPELKPVIYAEQALYDAQMIERLLAEQKVGPLPVVAANDLCANAEALSLGLPVAGATTDATTDPGAGTFCGTSISAPGVWYSIGGTGNTMTASLCGSAYDTKLSVFCGDCSSPICVGGNDDSCSLQSEVSWCSDASATYLILVHGFSSSVGSFTIEVTDDGVPCAGAIDCAPVGGGNDLCDNAIDLGTLPASVTGTTTGATPDTAVSTSCGTSITAPGVWYSFVGDGTTTTVSLCGGTNYDSKLSVFTGTCDAPVCVTGNDDFCGLQSEVTFCANTGVTYFILVHGFSSSTGDFTLDVTPGAVCECADVCQTGDTPEGEPVCFDEYDDQFNGGCNSTPPVFSDISCGDTVCGSAGTFLFTDPIFGTVEARDTDWYRFSLAGASNVTWTVTANFPVLVGIVDTGGVDDCSLVTDFVTSATGDPCVSTSVSADLGAGTWYVFVAPSSFDGVACGSEYRATLGPCVALPTGACCLPTGSCSDGLAAIECDNVDGTYQGDGSLCASVSCPQPPANDDCVNAIGPLSVPSTTPGTTILASIDLCSGPDIFCFDCGSAIISSPGVWYTVVGTGNTMTASLCSAATSYDSKLSVFCGTCDDPVCIDGNDDFCGTQSEVSWCSQFGAEYLILVHGFGGQTGDFELILSDDGTACSGAVACLPEGACCTPTDCVIATELGCAVLGGVYVGDGSQCAGTDYAQTSCVSAFEDISGTGSIGPSGDDGGQIAPLGFTFEFFGVNHTSVGMSTNGYLTFGLDLTDFSNDDIPDDNDPNDLIAVLWDDLIVDSSATIYYETLGTAPNRRSVCQWDNIRQLGGSDRYTFEVVLSESDNAIEMRYLSVVAPSFSGDYTIGIEDPSGTGGLAADADNVASGDCYRFELVTRPDPCDRTPPNLECSAEFIGASCDDDKSASRGDAPCPNFRINITATDNESGVALLESFIDIGCDQIPVADGQLIDLVCDLDDDLDDGFDDDFRDDAGPACGAWFVGDVLVIRSFTAVLRSHAEDFFGNTADCEVDICPLQCEGDCDDDFDTDVMDFAIFAADYGRTDLTPSTGGDLDGDGDSDVFDFAVLSMNFGCGNN